jgi:anti-sigma regulatory factor (Ser/Thr protein kinase)
MNVVTEHRLRNDPTEIRKIEEWVGDFARQARLSSELRHAVDLSLTEWITNIITYAYVDSQPHWIALRLQADDGEVRMVIEDDGRAFDPLAHPSPDTTAPLQDRPIGGLGIHMIRQMMDTVFYRREAATNVVTLVKRRT